MVQDLKIHFIYFFKEQNEILKQRFFVRVLYVELEQIIKGVLFSCNIFESGRGCLLYENLKQDIHLKIYEKVTIKNIYSLDNVNGFIFTFAKNYCLNQIERADKINKIKEVIDEYR